MATVMNVTFVKRAEAWSAAKGRLGGG